MNNIEMKKSKHIFYYDFLRALAIIGIISCHAAAGFVTKADTSNIIPWGFSVIFNNFRAFSIPIFVMLSGALLINKDYEVLTFIKKKFNRIFIPYIFWVVMSILFVMSTTYLAKHTGLLDSISINTIINIITGGSGIGRIYWFIWMILVVYVVLFIMNKIIKKAKIKNLSDSKLIKSIIILFIIYSICVTLNLFDIRGYTLLYYITFVGYGVLGYYLAKTDFTKFRISEKTILILSLILSILFYGLLIFKTMTLTIQAQHPSTVDFFDIINLILAVNGFLFFRYFEEYKGKITSSIYNKIRYGFCGKLISSLSKCSFGIYLNHIIILNIIKILVFDSALANHNPIKCIPFLIIVVLIISWIITLVMSKIPYIKKVSGA